MTSACILIRTRRGEFDAVVERIKAMEGAVRVFPVLGRYDVVVDFEAKDFPSLGNWVLKMNHLAGVVFTETLIEMER